MHIKICVLYTPKTKIYDQKSDFANLHALFFSPIYDSEGTHKIPNKYFDFVFGFNIRVIISVKKL